MNELGEPLLLNTKKLAELLCISGGFKILPFFCDCDIGICDA
ncbi:MAG: hypothetical protein ABSB11_11190 [Sedimentisphaerales bacterium]